MKKKMRREQEREFQTLDMFIRLLYVLLHFFSLSLYFTSLFLFRCVRKLEKLSQIN